jgi:hypothetical protein
MDFVSALKATNVSEEPKKNHALIIKEQLGALGGGENTGN